MTTTFGIDPRLDAATLRPKQPPRRTTVLKPSSNSTVSVAWITEGGLEMRMYF